MPAVARSLSVSQLLQRLTLRQLRAFIAVAEVSSMTQAAALMHLTPSALSMLIKSLEEELEIKLFERSTRQLTLTEPAKQLLPVVQALFAGLERSIEALRNTSLDRAQCVTVATSPLMAASLLPGMIASFRQLHPQIDIRLIDVPVDAVAVLVRESKADLGICTLDHAISDLKATRLMEDSLMLACPPAHPLASTSSVKWEQLLGQRMVLLSAGSGLRHLVDQTLNRLPLKARKQANASPAAGHSHEVSHVATAVGLVRAGEGIAVLPAYALRRALAEQQEALVVRPLTHPLVKRTVVALAAKDKPLSRNAQAFMAHMKLAVSASNATRV
jgi:LysR family transcriptional regulator, carnitine catabolism transcriptional activator